MLAGRTAAVALGNQTRDEPTVESLTLLLRNRFVPNDRMCYSVRAGVLESLKERKMKGWEEIAQGSRGWARRERTGEDRRGEGAKAETWMALTVQSYLSNAASLVLRVFRRVEHHHNLPHPSPLLGKPALDT